jgi:DNA-binding NarL/FixJ family response regulator
MPAVVSAPPPVPDRGPRSTPITVVLADDHELIRRTLRAVLEREHDMRVVAEARDLAMMTRHVRRCRPRVLVLDLGMPDRSSIDAIRRLRAQVPATAIVVVTMQEGAAFMRGTRAAGAAGYVLKEHAADELPLAVRAAAAGARYLSATARSLHGA